MKTDNFCKENRPEAKKKLRLPDQLSWVITMTAISSGTSSSSIKRISNVCFIAFRFSILTTEARRDLS